MLLILAGVFLIPSVQIYGAKKATAWFNQQFDQQAKVERFQYHFPNGFSLEEVLVPDHKGDTLFYIGSLEFSFKAWSQTDRALYLNSLKANEAYFYLYTQEGDSLSNLKVFIESLKGDKPPKPNQSFNVSASQVNLSDSRFYLENRNLPERIQFHWRKADADLNDFLLAGRDLSAQINSLNFKDGDKFAVQSGSGQFLYGPKGLVVQDLGLTTARSNLAGGFHFMMESPSYYSQFVDSVYMSGTIENAHIAAEDIRYFSDAYPRFPTASIRGDFEGTVNDLYLNNFELEAYQKMQASGQLHLVETTSGIDLKMYTDKLKIQAKASEARSLIGLFKDTIPEILDRTEFIEWQGSFSGGLFDFKTKSQLITKLADLNLDLDIQNLRSLSKVAYKGKVKANRLNLRAILPKYQDLGTASLNLSLDGKGIDPTKMESRILGQIQHFDFKGYRYRNMQVNGEIAEGNFNGKFFIKDPNLSLDFDGIASFGSDTSKYDFKAKVDSANLYAMNLVKDSLAQYRGSVDIDFKYLDTDRWEGNIDFFDLHYRNSKKTYAFNDVKIESLGLDSLKELSIASNMLDAQLKGSYSYGSLFKLFQQKLARYQTPQEYRPAEVDGQNFEFDLWVKDAAALSQSLLAQLLIEPGTHLRISKSPFDELLRVDFNSEGIRYGQHLIEGLDLSVLSGQADLFNLTANSYAIGEDRLQIDSVQFVNVFAGDSMNYQLDLILRDSIDSYGSFEGLIAILDSQAYRMNWDRGEFNFGSRSFQVDTGSVMRLDSNGFSIDWLKITGPSLNLTAAGFISPDPNRIMRIDIEGLDLDFLNYLQFNEKARVEGFIDGNIIATQLASKPKFIADVYLDSLRLNEVALGRMELSSDYNYGDGKIFIDALLKNRALETLKIGGYYDHEAKGSIDLKFDFNRFNLAALDPFAAPVAENLRGLASGSVSMTGPAKKPEIDGEFTLPKAGLTISFLQTDYNLVGSPKVYLNNESISFPNLKLRDARGTGFLNGEVRHRGFKDFYIDLQIDAQEMLVLNTSADREDAYYGTAYASGNLKIQGPPSSVKVYAAVKSEDGTNFNIPIGGATEVKQSGYVNFLPPKNASQGLQIMKTDFDIDEGVSLDFDMDITPDALVSIILNESTGNQLNGRGSGFINMKLEPNQDLELYGTYTIEDGLYRFNLEGLLAKNFEVQRGGTVSWNGDPYTANLDLTAIYRTKANPGILTGETNGASTAVDIYLYIEGELTNPNITFSVALPRATSSIQSIVANRLNTDQAVNQQVFSLLAFNNFTPPSDFLIGSGSAINQWDIIAGQAAAFINRFTAEYDYEVSLSYQPATQGQNAPAAGNSQEELEVGLSKNFFEDRLTVNSSVEVPLNENNSSIAGDFELIYKLTEDGRMRAKAFNRSVDNNLSYSIGQQQLYQQGVGINFKLDFNTYQELWARALGKGRREEVSEEDSEEDELEDEEIDEED